jgi:predicted phage-related endonuclease
MLNKLKTWEYNRKQTKRGISIMTKINLSESALSDLINKYKSFRLKKSEIEDEMEAIKDKIMAEMDIREVTKLEIDNNKVTLAEVSSTRFDSKQLEKDFPEMYNKYTKTSVSRRFLIS